MDKLLKRTPNEKIRTQRYPSRSYYSLLAENTGFEPADALTSTVFKTAALNHSANSPHLFCVGQKTVATVCQNKTHGLILSFVGHF